LPSIKTLVVSIKGFFLFLLENVIEKKIDPLELGASSETKKEIQAWWTLQKTNSVYNNCQCCNYQLSV
jgi:hypothetical protein